MLGKEVFSFVGRGSRRCELRNLVAKNRAAMGEVVGQQANSLSNRKSLAVQQVLQPRAGWRRFSETSSSPLYTDESAARSLGGSTFWSSPDASAANGPRRR